MPAVQCQVCLGLRTAVGGKGGLAVVTGVVVVVMRTGLGVLVSSVSATALVLMSVAPRGGGCWYVALLMARPFGHPRPASTVNVAKQNRQGGKASNKLVQRTGHNPMVSVVFEGVKRSGRW